MNRDFSDAPSLPPTPDDAPARNPWSSLAAWVAATLAMTAALAWVLGSATPRIRLIAIYPLCIGVCMAFLAMWTMIPLKLKITRGLILWILVISILAFAGSSGQSWRVWKKKLIRDHASTQRQIHAILKDFPAVERNRILRDNARTLMEKTTFEAYLSDRLLAFARQIGRQQVWPAPVPEIVFGGELVLALAGAYVMVAFGTGSGPWAPQRESEVGATP